MKRTILVVDDEQRIADTLKLILVSKGFQASVAYDGKSAIEKCRELRPDIVLSDVMMPGMTGIEMAIALRAEFPDMKVLLLSGQATTETLIHHARSQGYGFELLAKPIHPDALLEKLSNLS